MSITLNPIADAFVSQAAPTTNYGSSSFIYIRTIINSNSRAFLKFDLSSIPNGAIITLAQLKLVCYNVGNYLAGVSDSQARKVDDDSWIESGVGGIKWNNQPPHGDVIDTQAPSLGLMVWNITSYIQLEFSGDKVASICLRCIVEDYDATVRNTNWRSKEYGSNIPELYIEYILPVGGVLAQII